MADLVDLGKIGTFGLLRGAPPPLFCVSMSSKGVNNGRIRKYGKEETYDSVKLLLALLGQEAVSRITGS
jgi:hypothetical protein